MTTDFIQECIGNIMYKSCMPEHVNDPTNRLRNSLILLLALNWLWLAATRHHGEC